MSVASEEAPKHFSNASEMLYIHIGENYMVTCIRSIHSTHNKCSFFKISRLSNNISLSKYDLMQKTRLKRQPGRLWFIFTLSNFLFCPGVNIFRSHLSIIRNQSAVRDAVVCYDGAVLISPPYGDTGANPTLASQPAGRFSGFKLSLCELHRSYSLNTTIFIYM